MSDALTHVLQLANRLEDANGKEKYEALLELQSLARSQANISIIGKNAQHKIMDYLRENNSIDEYIDSLDLILKLVNCKKYGDIAKDNASILIDEVKNVELLLDLLDHIDVAVSVMASQILTEIHFACSRDLEAKIQSCPDGK